MAAKMQKYTVVPQFLAVLFLGLLGGFLSAYVLDIGPALQQLDASTYTQIQQKLDQTIHNTHFAVLFFGATLFPFLSAALAAMQGQRRVALYWLIVSLLHFLGVYWVTVVTTIPTHQEMLAWVASAPPADWVSADSRWQTSNAVRAVTELICFVAALHLLMKREQLIVQPSYTPRYPPQ